jgi:hypothetical protein
VLGRLDSKARLRGNFHDTWPGAPATGLGSPERQSDRTDEHRGGHQARAIDSHPPGPRRGGLGARRCPDGSLRGSDRRCLRELSRYVPELALRLGAPEAAGDIPLRPPASDRT